MTPLLIYAAVTIFLAGVDAARIHLEKGKRENINHAISRWLGIGTGIAVWVFTSDFHIKGGLIVLVTVASVIGFAGVRWLIYDIFLNLFRRERIDYMSNKTNSKKDMWFNRYGFWLQRVGAAWLIIIYFGLKIWAGLL